MLTRVDFKFDTRVSFRYFSFLVAFIVIHACFSLLLKYKRIIILLILQKFNFFIKLSIDLFPFILLYTHLRELFYNFDYIYLN